MLSEQARKKWAVRLILMLIGVGILLRINRYLHGLPFWGDEAWVALDILSRPYWAIISNVFRYPNLPAPPVGFILLEKFLVTLFGFQEVVFRFFPCVCGVAAVFLYNRFLQGLVRYRIVLIALAFFVFSNYLIYYSGELKQYSSDVLFTIIIYIFHFRALHRAMDEQSMLRLAIAGIVGLSFSLPIILVLCGMAFTQIAIYFQRRQLLALKRYILVVSLWFFWFGCLWTCCYHANYVGRTVISYQKPYYLSFPSTGSDWIVWFQKLFAVFQVPIELSWPWLAASMFVAGCWSLWVSKKELLLLLVAPILLTVCLSMLDKYPFHGRYLTFLVPSFFLLIAVGVSHVMDIKRWGWGAGGIILSILLIQPVVRAGSYLHPSGVSDVRSLVSYLKSHERTGDRIYLNSETVFGYFYYYYPNIPHMNELGKITEWFGEDSGGRFLYYYSYGQVSANKVYGWDRVIDPSGCKSRLPGGGRTWVLLSQIPDDAERFFVRCLNGFGTKLDEIRGNNAALYLYELK